MFRVAHRVEHHGDGAGRVEVVADGLGELREVLGVHVTQLGTGAPDPAHDRVEPFPAFTASSSSFSPTSICLR